MISPVKPDIQKELIVFKSQIFSNLKEHRTIGIESTPDAGIRLLDDVFKTLNTKVIGNKGTSG